MFDSETNGELAPNRQDDAIIHFADHADAGGNMGKNGGRQDDSKYDRDDGRRYDRDDERRYDRSERRDADDRYDRDPHQEDRDYDRSPRRYDRGERRDSDDRYGYGYDRRQRSDVNDYGREDGRGYDRDADFRYTRTDSRDYDRYRREQEYGRNDPGRRYDRDDRYYDREPRRDADGYGRDERQGNYGYEYDDRRGRGGRDYGYDEPRQEAQREAEQDKGLEEDAALMSEIDTFRNKAMQLEQLINAKQERVNALERLVEKAEADNTLLQDELAQHEAMDGVLSSMESRMAQLEETLQNSNVEVQVEQVRSVFAENQDRLTATLGDQQEKLDASFFKQQKQLEESLAAQQEKIDASLLAQQEKFDASFAKQQQKMDESIASLSNLNDLEIGTEKIEALMGEQKKALTATLDNQSAKLDGILSNLEESHNALSEKVHQENVRSYRNLQDYFTEQDHHNEDLLFFTKRFKTVRNFGILNILLTIVNIGICIFFLLLIL